MHNHEATSFSSRNILAAVRKQLQHYPASTLQDIYKSFFQDMFGPGHLLGDPRKARAYFDRELAGFKSRGRHRPEPCGCGLNFMRAPLDLVKDGLIGADEYFANFLSGAGRFTLPDPHAWATTWRSISEALVEMKEAIADFDADNQSIINSLEEGNYVMHHSRTYRLAYDPHYRIVEVRDSRHYSPRRNSWPG